MFIEGSILEIWNVIYFLVFALIGSYLGYNIFKNYSPSEKIWNKWNEMSKKDDFYLKIILMALGITIILAIFAGLFDTKLSFFESLFNSIMGIGAFVAAIFAAFVIVKMVEQTGKMDKQLDEMVEQRKMMDEQLNEMKNQTLEMQTQRKLQYGPELIAENIFRIYFHNCSEFLSHVSEIKDSDLRNELGIWSKSDKKPEKYQELILNTLSDAINEVDQNIKLKNLLIYLEKNVGLKIYNVGNGVAKEITYTWECDFDEFFCELKKNNYDPEVQDYITDPLVSKNDKGSYIEYCAGHVAIPISNSLVGGGKYNLLLPHRSSEDFLIIPLPYAILKPLGYFCKNHYSAHISTQLILTIEYKGIDNTKHITKYRISNFYSGPGSYSATGGLKSNNDYREFQLGVMEMNE